MHFNWLWFILLVIASPILFAVICCAVIFVRETVKANTTPEGMPIRYLSAILLGFIMGALIKRFLFSLVKMGGNAMAPTIKDGKSAVVNKIAYNKENPSRLDIVLYETSDGDYSIKRVIGLPGEKVIIKDGECTEDGRELLTLRNSEVSGTYTLSSSQYLLAGDGIEGEAEAVSEEKIIGKVYKLP